MKTKVIFRKDKKTNEVFAIFPYLFHAGAMNVFFDGCHGGGDYHHMMQTSTPAKEEEYKYLNRILFNFYGYDTQVIKHYNHAKWIEYYYSTLK